MSKQDLERRIAQLEQRVKELEDIVEGKAVISVPTINPNVIAPSTTIPTPWPQRMATRRDYAMG